MGFRHKLYGAGGVQFIYVTNPNEGFMSGAQTNGAKAHARSSSKMGRRLTSGAQVRWRGSIPGFESGAQSNGGRAQVRSSSPGLKSKEGHDVLLHKNILTVSVLFSYIL